MAISERRITPRFKLHPPLSFHRREALSDGEQQAKAIIISTRGVYFVTNLVLRVGETVELLTGAKVSIRRFTGRVTHVELENMPLGLSGIGVQLLYYERDLAKIVSKRL